MEWGCGTSSVLISATSSSLRSLAHSLRRGATELWRNSLFFHSVFNAFINGFNLLPCKNLSFAVIAWIVGKLSVQSSRQLLPQFKRFHCRSSSTCFSVLPWPSKAVRLDIPRNLEIHGMLVCRSPREKVSISQRLFVGHCIRTFDRLDYLLRFLCPKFIFAGIFSLCRITCFSSERSFAISCSSGRSSLLRFAWELLLPDFIWHLDGEKLETVAEIWYDLNGKYLSCFLGRFGHCPESVLDDCACSRLASKRVCFP